jgi:hypothetical protein
MSSTRTWQRIQKSKSSSLTSPPPRYVEELHDTMYHPLGIAPDLRELFA